MSVLDSFRCGFTFGGTGCGQTWLASTISALEIALGVIALFALVWFVVHATSRSHGRARISARAINRGSPSRPGSLTMSAATQDAMPDATRRSNGAAFEPAGVGRLLTSKPADHPRGSRPSTFGGLVANRGRNGELRPLRVHGNLLALGNGPEGADSRVLAPAIVLRNGPAVVVSASDHLAAMTAGTLNAQRSCALWWQPTGSMLRPPGATPIGWDPVSHVVDAPGALQFARTLVALVDARLPGERALDSIRAAAIIVAGIVLAPRIGAASPRRSLAWLTGGPDAWKNAVATLDRADDEDAWALGGQLDFVARNAPRWYGEAGEALISEAARVLEVTRPLAAGTRHRPFYPRLFLSGGSDVLFIGVPPERRPTMEIAASLLLMRLAHLRSEMHDKVPPLAVVLDGIESTVALPDMGTLLENGPASGLIWTATVGPGSHRQHRRPGTSQWPMRLRFEGGGDPSTGKLYAPRHRPTTVRLPLFEEDPWTAIRGTKRPSVLAGHSTRTRTIG